MKYTITRALSELKTLKARYSSEVRKLNLIAVKHGSKLRSPNNSMKPEDFADKAKEQWQKVTALEDRIHQIKVKVEKSNAVTMVKIGDKEMTVEEALIMKNNIIFKEERLNFMKSLQTKAQREYDNAEEENRRRIDEQVKNMTTAGASKDPEVEKKVLESMEKLYEVTFVDPISLSDKIQALEKEIQDFNTNVDFALSESNSTTFIDVDD